MSISAMKQALEALNIIKASFSEGRMAHAENEAAIAEHILRQAIAEAEKQEPVSIKKVAKAHGIDMPDHFRDATKKVVPSDHTNSHQPVAWREIMGKWKTHYYDYNEDGRGEPLYTAPREWVGLRDEDLPEGETYDFDRGVRWAESKLKERNT